MKMRLLFQDILVFLLCLFLVLGTWFFLGWDPDLFLGNHDYILGHFPLMKLMLGNQLNHINFSETILGGAYISPIWGSSLLYDLLYRLGMDAGAILNSAVIFSQTAILFMGHKLNEGITGRTEIDGSRLFTLLIMNLLVAFNPLISWRVEHGHLPFLQSCSFFIGLLTLTIIFRCSKLPSLFLSLIIWIAMANSLTQQAFQLVLYSGIAILPAFFMARKLDHKQAFLLAVFFVSLGVFILPEFKMMLDYSRSELSSRAIGVKALYSYLITSWSQWDTIVVLNKEWISSTQSFLLHETHYPIVPAMTALFVLRKNLPTFLRQWSIALGSFGLFCFFASLNPPVLGSILENIPLLSSFRIIGRGNLVAGMGLYTILALVIAERPHRKVEMGTIALLWLILRFFEEAHPYLEILFWITAFISVVAQFLIKNKTRVRGIESASIGLLGLSLFFSSQSILNPHRSISLTENHLSEVKKALREKGLSPQDSVLYLGPLKNILGLNLNMALDHRGIEGYWQPTREFNQFFSQTTQQKTDPTRLVFNVQSPSHLSQFDDQHPIQFIAEEHPDGVTITETKNKGRAFSHSSIPSFVPSETFTWICKSMGICLLLIFLFFLLRFNPSRF